MGMKDDLLPFEDSPELFRIITESVDDLIAVLDLDGRRLYNSPSYKSIFGDPMAYTFADPDHSIGEERWLIFGQSRMGRILAVIYTHRRGSYRLISARLATRHERKIYEEG